MFAPGSGRTLGPVGAVLAVFVALTAARLVEILPGLLVVLLLAALFVFLLVFLRDPDRPVGEGIVSAADGRVRAVETQDGRCVISVFMNVSDVHVNRVPMDARVVSTRGEGQGHQPAYRPAAQGNVQRRYELSTAVGSVEVVQVTGIFARRLVSFVGPGADLRKGDRFGMIALGSRVDVRLPAGRVIPTVRVGDRVRAGTTTIARELP
ncbi:MAG TPA: phosphatidylserine decarboxylase [Thermoplasmata archaeon]|nr:phosphatidylserine decarboxylase [Thermoplasmata archaeon]